MAHKIRQQICANCSHTFNAGENFCPNCGQENHSPNQPIKHYTAELIESIFHLDSKIYLTLKTMLIYPGKITREYNINMRARFTPPIRLYVFISFIFFVLLQIPEKKPTITITENITTSESNDSLDAFANLEYPDSLANTEMDTTKKGTSNLRVKSSRGKKAMIQIFGLAFSKEDLLKYKNASNNQIDSLIISQNAKPNYFTRTLVRQIIKINSADEDFSDRIKEKTIHFASLSLFLLMPFFALLLKLVYYKRKLFYYEYLIFSVHLHTVVFLFFSLIIILNFFIATPTWVFWLYSFGLLFYLGKALRYNYQGSRMRTILKMIFICLFYSIVSLIVFLLSFGLGLWFV